MQMTASPLAVTDAEKLRPILFLYKECTGVRGLNINIAKTTALCINTLPYYVGR